MWKKIKNEKKKKERREKMGKKGKKEENGKKMNKKRRKKKKKREGNQTRATWGDVIVVSDMRMGKDDPKDDSAHNEKSLHSAGAAD